jgi:hypothetical protein
MWMQHFLPYANPTISISVDAKYESKLNMLPREDLYAVQVSSTKEAFRNLVYPMSLQQPPQLIIDGAPSTCYTLNDDLNYYEPEHEHGITVEAPSASLSVLMNGCGYHHFPHPSTSYLYGEDSLQQYSQHQQHTLSTATMNNFAATAAPPLPPLGEIDRPFSWQHLSHSTTISANAIHRPKSPSSFLYF